MSDKIVKELVKTTLPEGVTLTIKDSQGNVIQPGRFLAANEKLSKEGKLLRKCQFCGKWIEAQDSLETLSGGTCLHQRKDQGLDDAKLLEHRKFMTVAKIPTGYVKVADVHRKLVDAKVAVSKMVKAFGSDRCLDPNKVAHPSILPLYDLGGKRWISGWYVTKQGIQAINARDFSKAPKAPEAEALIASWNVKHKTT